MDGVHVAQNQDAGLPRLLVRKSAPHAIAVPHVTGNTLYACAHDGQIACGQIHHPVNGIPLECGTFLLDPDAQALDHVLQVEGNLGEVHIGG